MGGARAEYGRAAARDRMRARYPSTAKPRVGDGYRAIRSRVSARSAALHPSYKFSSPPNLIRYLDDPRQLGPLLVLGQDIAFLGRGEAALRREAKLIEGDELRGLVN